MNGLPFHFDWFGLLFFGCLAMAVAVFTYRRPA